MNEHSVFESRFRPNEEQLILAASIFYAGNAGFLSYFGSFREIPREFETHPEGCSSDGQGVIGRCLARCVAIV